MSRSSADPKGQEVAAWQALLGDPVLSAAEQLALTVIARTRTVPAGAAVFDRLEAASSLVALSRGEVALGYRDAEGVFHLERPVHGPAWLDQSAAWLDDSHALDARAVTECIVVDIPQQAIQAQLAQHPGLAQRLLVSLAREVRSLTMNTHDLMHKDAPARFAAWLVERCDCGDGQRGVVRLGQRKRDIASQLAITPETLSRLMRSLSRQGLIQVAGYTVQVLDITGLRQLSAGA
jgi:CRP-like cAMP-binding protein